MHDQADVSTGSTCLHWCEETFAFRCAAACCACLRWPAAAAGLQVALLCQRICKANRKAAQQQLQLCSRHGFQHHASGERSLAAVSSSCVGQTSFMPLLATNPSRNLVFRRLFEAQGPNRTCGVEAPLARLVDDCLPRLRIQLRDDIPAGLAASEHPATGPLRPDARACSNRRVKIHDS